MAEASEKTPVKSEEKAIERAPAEWSPLLHLRREFDRMIEDFPWSWRRPLTRSLFDVEPFWRGFAGLGAMPAVDIAEKDKEYEITAELPGLDESNIDVKFADGVLTIKGEKKDEKEERKKDYYLRAPLWLLPAQLSGSGERGCEQDRGQVRQRRAHVKVAEESRGTEEREEDRNQERLGARHRAHLSRHARRDQDQISPPFPPQRPAGAAGPSTRNGRLRGRLVRPARGGGSYGHCINSRACRPCRWARARRRLSGPRYRRDLVADRPLSAR